MAQRVLVARCGVKALNVSADATVGHWGQNASCRQIIQLQLCLDCHFARHKCHCHPLQLHTCQAHSHDLSNNNHCYRSGQDCWSCPLVSSPFRWATLLLRTSEATTCCPSSQLSSIWKLSGVNYVSTWRRRQASYCLQALPCLSCTSCQGVNCWTLRKMQAFWDHQCCWLTEALLACSNASRFDILCHCRGKNLLSNWCIEFCLPSAGESTIFNVKMIVGSLLACIGFAGYSFIRLMTKQNQLQVEQQKESFDVEKGSDIKQKLLDDSPEDDLITASSLPRKRWERRFCVVTFPFLPQRMSLIKFYKSWIKSYSLTALIPT